MDDDADIVVDVGCISLVLSYYHVHATGLLSDPLGRVCRVAKVRRRGERKAPMSDLKFDDRAKWAEQSLHISAPLRHGLVPIRGYSATTAERNIDVALLNTITILQRCQLSSSSAP